MATNAPLSSPMVHPQRPCDWNANCTNSNSLAGMKSLMSRGSGSRGTAGRLEGSFNAFKWIGCLEPTLLPAVPVLLKRTRPTGPTSWPSPTASHQDLCDPSVAAPAVSEQLSPLTIDEHVKSLGEFLLTQRSSTSVCEHKESRASRAPHNSLHPWQPSWPSEMSLKNLGTDFRMHFF